MINFETNSPKLEMNICSNILTKSSSVKRLTCKILKSKDGPIKELNSFKVSIDENNNENKSSLAPELLVKFESSKNN